MALEKSPVLRLPGLHGKLVGREDELGRLERAWKDGNNVISVVAWGGVGKTALVATWLAQMALGGYDGARYVFTWSFYSQGTDNLAASADGFMDAALRFFGDDDPHAGTAWERGERLAGLVAAEKAVLVLDGLIDLARACFENFRHERILDLLAGFDRADDLGDMLKQDNPPFRACKDLITPDLIARVQQACAGRDNQVYFNSQTRDVFKAESAPINRLLALLLCAAGQAEPVPGWLTVQRKDGELIASIQQFSGITETITADHIVARHGPRYTDGDGKPCRFIEKKFPRLAAQCKDLGGTLADLRITETLDRQTFRFFADLSASS